MARHPHSTALSLALVVVLVPGGVAARSSEPVEGPTTATAAPAPTSSLHPLAVAAHEHAIELEKQGEYGAAVAELDHASNLEPQWEAPVRLRAEIFATLAKKHHRSEAFTAARADELERLQTIAPGPETTAMQDEIASLRRQSVENAKFEAKRRKLITPAIIFGTSSVSVLLAGILLYVQKPRPFLEPTAYRQYRRDQAGIALMSMGGLLLIPTVVLGVLASRQARNDSATRTFMSDSGRYSRKLSFAPQLHRGGGGMGLHLRF